MAFLPVLIFILGLVFGSFSSVLIHRLHRHEKGIFLGRSKCPQCQARLGARDLIPLISYVLNGQKCRFCKRHIAWVYPALELTMAGSFLLTTLLVGPRHFVYWVFMLIITFVFVTISFYDILYQEIPDSVILPATLLTIAYMLITKSMAAGTLGIGILVPVVFFGFLFFVSKGEWLGGGDIRIGAMMGALLGWPKILLGLFLGYLLGSLWSAGGILAKKLTRKSHIPFAPFLLLGTYIAYFWYHEITQWYLSLTMLY